MAELVDDCPRCKAAQITFDVLSASQIKTNYNWQRVYEASCRCRKCKRTTIFQIAQSTIQADDMLRKGFPTMETISLNDIFRVDGYVSLKDVMREEPPEFLDEVVELAFREAATCAAVQCWNAAGVMCRVCIDLATRPLLPPAEEAEPNHRVRRDLGLRLPWLIQNGRIPADLEDLSTCIREDGNDGAHQGTLTAADAEDLIDFTRALLDRLYTQPARLRQAAERRAERRNRGN